MKKFHAAFWIVILISVLVFAQQQTKVGKSGYDDYVFSPEGEEFSIESCPVAFVARGAADDKAGRRYLAAVGGAYFYVFSDAAKSPAQYKVVSDFVKYFQTAGTAVYINDSAGEKFTFADAEGFFHKILIVKTEKCIYVFQTVSPSENNSEAERFFAGVQFKRRLPPAGLTTAPEEKKSNETLTAETKNLQTDNGNSGIGTGGGQGNGIGSGSGAGEGSGQGTGQGTGGGISPPANAGQTTPLNIQTKPRAGYTDFARFYEISGAVSVRVTFAATGEIGAVTPLTKLPFGLTNQALTAARAIRFSPAMKNGQPVTVVKMVEYRFTIY